MTVKNRLYSLLKEASSHQRNHGFRVQLYGLRLQPEFELRLCVPSGLLHRSRQQGLRLLLRRRRHQVQIRQGGQDSSLLRNRQLLGNPEEEDQDQVQHLLPIVPVSFTWVPAKSSPERPDIGSRPKPSESLQLDPCLVHVFLDMFFHAWYVIFREFPNMLLERFF